MLLQPFFHQNLHLEYNRSVCVLPTEKKIRQQRGSKEMKEYESPGSKKDRAPNCRWCKRDSDTPRRTSLAYMMIEIRGK